MRRPHRVEILSQARLFDDFFKIDEVKVSHERADGTMSSAERRLIFERGDAVAVLLFNPDTHEVVLVDQFRMPALISRRRDDPATMNGWITEAVAGMINANETPEEAVVRETMEETGYKIENPRLICNFFSSPGGTSERIFLYFATISASDRTGKGGGIGDEDIRVVHVHAHELFAQLAKGEIDDPKLAIAGYWLQEHLRQIGALDPATVQYQVKNKPGLIVGYKTGAIDHVRGVSIWVNSENTDMMMDRFIGRTISARIRYLGANKEEDSVVEDTIQESLRGVIGERAHVKIGTVLVTESGMLSGSHQVQRVFHVATVEGGPGGGVKADGNKLIECVERVLTRVDRENNKLWRNVLGKKLDTILFPLLGAGDGGLSVESVAQKLIPVAVNYFRSTPHPTLKEIYFLAFRSRDKSACAKVLDGFCEQGALQRIEGTK